MNSQIQQRFPARLDHRRPLGGAHAADGIRDIVLCLHHPGISLHLIITRQGSEGLAARLPIEGRTAPIRPNCPGRRGATLRAPLLSVIAWPSFLAHASESSRKSFPPASSPSRSPAAASGPIRATRVNRHFPP